MEFFLILFIVMIVLNAINAAMQKAKGDQQAPPARPVRQIPPELEEISTGRLRFQRVERRGPDYHFMEVEEGKSSAHRGDDSVKRMVLQQDETQPPVQATFVSSKLEKMFGNREDLVAAFIFHEVIGRPRSMRRR